MSKSESTSSFGRRLRTPAAAEYLGIAASTLEKMRVSGTGPEFERVGKKAVVYSVEALEAYLAQRRARSTSETEIPNPRFPRRKKNHADAHESSSPGTTAPGSFNEGEV